MKSTNSILPKNIDFTYITTIQLITLFGTHIDLPIVRFLSKNIVIKIWFWLIQVG